MELYGFYTEKGIEPRDISTQKSYCSIISLSY